MDTLRKNLARYLFPIILILSSLIVSFQNFTAETWLTGWDNLHPEFNLTLNLNRALSAVWQEYQGVGLLGGMSHAADLPRVIFLYLTSIFVPLAYLRYFWAFLMLTIGPLGAYWLIKFIISKGKNSTAAVRFAAFFGALFYLFNLATVQYFFTPYEAFVSFYGFLPWILYVSLKFLQTGKIKNLLFAGIVFLLATPAFYVQTLFIVAMVTLSIFSIPHLKSKKAVVNFIVLTLTIAAINSFWLLPTAYFTLTSSHIVTEAKINSISTPETQLYNEGAGSIKDLALLKGFWFYYTDLGPSGKYEFLMEQWRQWFSESVVAVSGYALFALSLLGLITGAVSKKIKIAAPLTLFIFSFIILSSTNAPFAPIFKILNKIPLFSEAFRSVFTKWSIPFALSISFGISFFIHTFISTKKKFVKIFGLLSTLLVTGFIFATTLPMFGGNLIMKPVRIQIPSEYFQVFKFFQNEPKEARIAYFPVHSLWGWNFYSWGYRGSGFVWYGIEQPILDRAFDVWSPYNESFYTEIRTALDENNYQSVGDVLDKYDVSYIFLDENIILPDTDNSKLKIKEVRDIADKLNFQTVFSEGKITIFRTNNYHNGFVYGSPQYSLVDTSFVNTKRDLAYTQNGDYIQSTHEKTYEYVNADLLKDKIDNIYFDKDTKAIKFTKQIKGNSVLTIPTFENGTSLTLNANLSYVRDNLNIEFDPVLTIEEPRVSIGNLPPLNIEVKSDGGLIVVINDQQLFLEKEAKIKAGLAVTVGDPISFTIYDSSSGTAINLNKPFTDFEFRNCWTREGFEGYLDVTNNLISKIIKTKDAAACSSTKIGDFQKHDLLIFSLPYKSYDNSRPSFCILEEGVEGCKNPDIFYTTSPSSEWAEVSRGIVTNENGYWVDITARPPDTPGEEWSIEYKTPSVKQYKALGVYIFSDPWSDFHKDIKINIPETLNYSVSTAENLVDFAKKGLDKPVNCDVFKRGSVSKNLGINEVIYRASDLATLCDYVSLVDTSSANSYVFQFDGNTESGRGLKFYLLNKATNSPNLEQLLPTSSYTTFHPTIAWPNEPKEYILNVEAKSFGKESINILNGVRYYQIPSDWLSQWVVGDKETRESSLQVTNVKKTGTYKYKLRLEGSGLLILSQGYNNGWIAYQNGEKLEHVKVNSWANGWVVPQTTTPSNITIIFWPQYLEYLGFMLLGVTLLILLARFYHDQSSGHASDLRSIINN